LGFAAALAAMSDRQLTDLLRARPDLVSPRPHTLAELASRAASLHSVQLALGIVDRFALQVLHTCCLLADGEGPTRVAALLRGADGNPPGLAAVQAALDRLRALALVTGDGAGIDVPGQTRQLLAHPAGLGRPAEGLFATRSRADLDRVSTLVGVTIGGNKPDQIARLVRTLAEPGTIRRVMAGAPAEARARVEELTWRSPLCRLPHDYWYGGSRNRAGWSHWLVERGLIVPSGYLEAEMPREVGLALRDGVAFAEVEAEAPVLTGAVNDPGSVDKDAGARADTAVRAVAAVLWAWGEAPAPALKSGGLGIRELRKAARIADVGEAAMAQLLEVAAHAGLLATGGDGPRPGPGPGPGVSYRPTGDFDAWLDASPAQRWAVLAEAWLAVPGDLAAAGRAGPDGKLGPVLVAGWHNDPGPARRRRGVLDQLRRLGPGVAPGTEALARALSWAAPTAWSVEPGRALQCCAAVLEQAALLGITGQDALCGAARLLLEGRRDEAVAAAADLLSEPATTFTLQADLTCVATGSLDAGVSAELGLLAMVESTGAATVYRFSEASLRRSFDAGRSADDVGAFLAAHASKGVPQALAYLVTDSYRRYGTLRAGAVQSYLRAEEPALVEQVMRMRRAGGLGLRVLAPGVAVSSAPVARLLDALRSNGFSPAEEDNAGGVVVSAPAQHRAPAVPVRPRRAVAGSAVPADVAAVVAALRSPPRDGRVEEPGTDGRGRPRARSGNVLPFPSGGEGGDVATGQHVDELWAHDPDAMVLIEAMVTRQSVEVGFTGESGYEEVEGMVVDVDDQGRVRVVVPDGTSRIIDLQAIEYVEPLDELDDLDGGGLRW